MKRKKTGVMSRIGNWLLGEPEKSVQQAIRENGGFDVTQLPEDDNDITFDGGSRIVNGTFCRTVGEYKDALQKNDTDMGGRSG